MFDKILVPIDGSEGATTALRTALEIGQRFEAELLLLSVYRHHSLLGATTYMPTPGDYETTDESMRQYAGEVVETAKKIVAQEGAENVHGFVKGGPPARTIVGFAEEHDVGLIVVGSRGLGDVEGFLLGSVFHKVTSLTKCLVLVV